jgi:hypothetical protein
VTKRLDSLAAIATHRRAQGDTVDDSDNRLILVSRVGTGFSSIEMRWQTSTGTLHLFEVLPLDVPRHAMTAVAAAIMSANTKLGIPGFQLRESPAGWRIVFLAYAFLDDDQATSPRVVDELLRAVRINAAAYRSQFAARIAEASKPPEAERIAQFGRKNPRLDSPQMTALRTAIERAVPSFEPRLPNAHITELVLPFFARMRILEVASPIPTPARVVYCALDPANAAYVLTGRLEELQTVCRTDPPAVASTESALVFLNLVAVWTAEETGELRIATFDDIPWTSPASTGRISELRANVAARISPPDMTAIDGGHRLEYWSVARSRLLHRTISIQTSGALDVTTEVVADLPVPPGNVWSLVGGRLVPTA